MGEANSSANAGDNYSKEGGTLRKRRYQFREHEAKKNKNTYLR